VKLSLGRTEGWGEGVLRSRFISHYPTLIRLVMDQGPAPLRGSRAPTRPIGGPAVPPPAGRPANGKVAGRAVGAVDEFGARPAAPGARGV